MQIIVLLCQLPLCESWPIERGRRSCQGGAGGGTCYILSACSCPYQHHPGFLWLRPPGNRRLFQYNMMEFSVFQQVQKQPRCTLAETQAPAAVAQYPSSDGCVPVPWGFFTKLRDTSIGQVMRGQFPGDLAGRPLSLRSKFQLHAASPPTLHHCTTSPINSSCSLQKFLP